MFLAAVHAPTTSGAHKRILVVQYTRAYEHFVNETIVLLQSAPLLVVPVGEGAYCPYNNETLRDDFLSLFTASNLNKNGDRGDILSGALCCTMDGFFSTGGIKKHDMRYHMSWQYHPECEGHDKHYQYLNHPNVSLVVTVQHQHLDHPKVLSIPLGQQSNATGALQKQVHPDWFMSNNRTNLLLINCDASPTRKPILHRVIANFGGNITNKKDPACVDEYFQQLSNSKYTLSPSGMGWD